MPVYRRRGWAWAGMIVAASWIGLFTFGLASETVEGGPDPALWNGGVSGAWAGDHGFVFDFALRSDYAGRGPGMMGRCAA